MSDYTPKGTLPNVPQPQIRLGLQAPGGGGKTTSALTFPNCTVADFDNSLTAYPNIPCIKFWDQEWLAATYPDFKAKKSGQPYRSSDLLLKWMREEALKMQYGQTLIIDSWSAIQDNFDMTHVGKFTKTGEVDEYDFWNQKFEYSTDLCSLICSCKCDVVVTFHDNPVRDKNTGVILDKIAPLMKGQFVLQLKRYFTDFYRVVTEDKKNVKGEVTGSTYLWQVRSNNKFDAKCRIKDLEEGIFTVPATYQFFIDQNQRKKPETISSAT